VAAKRYLTKAQVAELLGVSKRTVQRWIASGRLRAVRLGRNTVRIAEDTLK
jgi:excisionase family DNA binding protein